MPGLDTASRPCAARDEEEHFVLDAFPAKGSRERQALFGTEHEEGRREDVGDEGRRRDDGDRAEVRGGLARARVEDVADSATVDDAAAFGVAGGGRRLVRQAELGDGLLPVPRVGHRDAPGPLVRVAADGEDLAAEVEDRPGDAGLSQHAIGELERVALAPGALVDAGVGGKPHHGAVRRVDAKMADARSRARGGERCRRRDPALAAQVPRAGERKNRGIEGALGARDPGEVGLEQLRELLRDGDGPARSTLVHAPELAPRLPCRQERFRAPNFRQRRLRRRERLVAVLHAHDEVEHRAHRRDAPLGGRERRLVGEARGQGDGGREKAQHQLWKCSSIASLFPFQSRLRFSLNRNNSASARPRQAPKCRVRGARPR